MTNQEWSPAETLIVDDDPLFLAIAESFFRSKGCERVLVAQNGVEALKILDACKQHPDLVLADLNMPKMDGLQFLRFLKERSYSNPIIIISSEHRSVVSLAQKLAKTHELNVVAALSKPLRPKELENALQKAERNVSSKPRNVSISFSVEEMQTAILADQFIPYYQPKICARTGRVVGAEALARWLQPDFGIIGPDSFIPLAETTGLIKPLTDNILRKVVTHARQLKNRSFQLNMAINFSVDALSDVTLPDKLNYLIEQQGLRAEDFTLELTETQLINGNVLLIEVFARLRMLGYKLSIDDFGTAYSNLENLTHLPFTELKIDRMFVSRALADERAMASVDTSIALARTLGMKIVAEGVETREDWDFLAERNVDTLQGFYFAKPMPFEQLLEFVADRQDYAENKNPHAHIKLVV